MPGIFINYRRDDAPGVAGRLYDHLTKSFSRRDLFIDVDAIKPGRDFVQQLDTEVSQCTTLLALIGPHWLDAVDEQGRQRLHDERDYVRIEIAAALKRDIPVIPVLVHGATMPAEDQLPPDLKSLSRRHALELRHTRFAADAEALVAALKEALPRRNRRWPLVAAAAGVLAVLGVGATLYALRGTTPFQSTATLPPATSVEISAPSAPAAASAPRNVVTREAPPPEANALLPDKKPMLGIEGITVALGDLRESVREAYPAASQTGAGDLTMPLSGIRFFFTPDHKVLREIMVEAPFKGGVDGTRIGDAAEDVVARLGQPYAIGEVYNGFSYLYHAGGNILSYHFDGKSKKVTGILQVLDSDAPPAPPSPSAPRNATAREAPAPDANAPLPDEKPMPGIEGITVALGAPRDSVTQAYPAAAQTSAGDLTMPLSGIRFFFTADHKVLSEIMVEAPFKGYVDGTRIGDASEDVVARRGQPYAIGEVYGGFSYLYHAGGNILSYHFDGKSKKVKGILQALDGR